MRRTRQTTYIRDGNIVQPRIHQRASERHNMPREQRLAASENKRLPTRTRSTVTPGAGAQRQSFRAPRDSGRRAAQLSKQRQRSRGAENDLVRNRYQRRTSQNQVPLG